MLRFRQMKSLQKFASVHAHFNQDRHLVDRQTYKAAARPPWLSGRISWSDQALGKGEFRQSEKICRQTDSTGGL